MTYIRTWLPFWTRCILTGLAAGTILAAAITALTTPAIAPTMLIGLEIALTYIRMTGGTRALIAATKGR